MLDSIGTPEIIDIAIAGAIILLGAAGFWRGVIKELFISAALLLGYAVSLEWAPRWGRWIGDQTSSLSTAEAQYLAIAGTLLLMTIVLGYVACTVASLPPADLPGRLGGLILGAANATFAVAILVARARQLVLDPSQRASLADTRTGDWLAGDLDWVILAMVGAGAVLLLGGLVTRRRRRTLLLITGAPPAGASGFKVRRHRPLAPEAEKLDGSAVPDVALNSWPDHANMANTVPITRVSDPSRPLDRMAAPERTVTVLPIGFSSVRDEPARCVSCGERITENDRFCPRCGRMLIAG